MRWNCIVSFDRRGRAGEEVLPSHIDGGQGGEVDRAGEQDGSNIFGRYLVDKVLCGRYLVDFRGFFWWSIFDKTPVAGLHIPR